MGSEDRSLPKHPHWSRTPATNIQPWERKRMKLVCGSFSSHGLCSLKHPACIQPGTRIVVKGHTLDHLNPRDGTNCVDHIPPTKSQKYQVGPALEPQLRGMVGGRLGSVLQGLRADSHSQFFTLKSSHPHHLCGFHSPAPPLPSLPTDGSHHLQPELLAFLSRNCPQTPSPSCSYLNLVWMTVWPVMSNRSHKKAHKLQGKGA